MPKVGIHVPATSPRLIAKQLGSSPTIVKYYSNFTLAAPDDWLDKVFAIGSTPMITWEPFNGLDEILNGSKDDYIAEWARTLKSYSKLGKVYLRFAHEFNGTWYPWSTNKHDEAWIKVHRIFQQNNATNVLFVWSPNVIFPGSRDIMSVYPGDDYVDWIGLDGYNWANNEQPNRSFNNLFNPTIKELAPIIAKKPLMIAEVGCAEKPGVNKAQWITDAYNKCNPNIRVICWFSENKEEDWRYNSSSAAKRAFLNVVDKFEV